MEIATNSLGNIKQLLIIFFRCFFKRSCVNVDVTFARNVTNKVIIKLL